MRLFSMHTCIVKGRKRLMTRKDEAREEKAFWHSYVILQLLPDKLLR